jgi:hypothetical protein
MSDWTLIPCLGSLREEFNVLNPKRDKGSDGSIGDSSHTSSSDHTPDEDSDKLRNKDSDSINEVHAIDVDSTGPWPGTNFHAIIMKVIEGEKKKWKDPNDKCRLNYVIHDGHIYDKDNDFNAEVYTATDDPHTGHAHFSARYETSCEKDTRPWGIVATFGDEGFMSFVNNQTEFNKAIAESWKDTNVVNQFLSNVKVDDFASPDDPNPVLNLRQWIGYSEGRRQVAQVADQVSALAAQVTKLQETINSHVAGLIEK